MYVACYASLTPIPAYLARLQNLKTPEELEEEDRAAQAAVSALLFRYGSDLTSLAIDYKETARADQTRYPERPGSCTRADEDHGRRCTPLSSDSTGRFCSLKLPQEPDKKPDYEQQTQKELNGIQQRVLLLNEMLNNAKPEERFVKGDAFDVRAVMHFFVRVAAEPPSCTIAIGTAVTPGATKDSAVDHRGFREQPRSYG
jgi:hypothetical protein